MLRDLYHADIKIVVAIIRSTLLTTTRRDLFLEGSATPLFVVIAFPPGTDLRPILREMYRFFQASGIFAGSINSGTALSVKLVNSVHHGFFFRKTFGKDYPTPNLQ